MTDINQQAKVITPQSIESNDGKFRIEVVDEGMLKLTTTVLDASNDNYMHEENDWVQSIEFDYESIDRLIEILIEAKRINPYAWGTMLRKFKKNEDEYIQSW